MDKQIDDSEATVTSFPAWVYPFITPNAVFELTRHCS